MEYNYLGKTGLKVSSIGFGGMNLGKMDKSDAFSILDRVHDLGINLIDTANAYTNSEKIIGEWMNKHDLRSEMIINTKVGWPIGEGINERGLSNRHITQQLNESCEKLNTDYIDIYQPHYYDSHEELRNLVHLFHEFQEQNKITVIGAPLFTRSYKMVSWHYIAQEEGLNSIASKLMTTSLLSRGMYDGDTRHIARDYNIGLITFGALGGGLLTGKYHSSLEFPPNGKEMFRKIVEGGKIDGLIDRLREISKSEDVSIAKLCFSWVLSHDFMASTIIGASNPEQLEDIIDARNIKLSEDILDELTELSNQYKLW